MSTADLFDDDWPHTHGTADGYDNGCRGGACPAHLEHGMSCKQAKTLSRSDFRYQRLVNAGHTPAEISGILNGTEPTSAAQPLAESSHDPEPQEDAKQLAIEEETPAEATSVIEAEEMGHPTPTPKETPTMPTPHDAAKASKPLTAEPVEEPIIVVTALEPRKLAEPLLVSVQKKRAADLVAEAVEPQVTAPRIPASQVNDRAIREWAHHYGIDVNQRGKVRTDVVDQYRAAHDIWDDISALAPSVDAQGPATTERLDELAAELAPGGLDTTGEGRTIQLEPGEQITPLDDAVALAEFGEDFGPVSDLLDETRERIGHGLPATALPTEIQEHIIATEDQLTASLPPAAGPNLDDETTLPTIALGHGPWMHPTELAWRKAIADQVRRNCTPSSDAYAKGGDILVYAVCDWIEDPPAWSHFDTPASPVTAGAGPIVDITGPMPEWAHVTINEDVERARNLAVMLEQECARLTNEVTRVAAERDQALAAMSTALIRWDADREGLHKELNELVEVAADMAAERAKRLEELEEENRTLRAEKRALTVKVIRLERPWWKRARR